MASFREHVAIERPADQVWAVVGDVGSVADWFPGMTASEATETERSCTLRSGLVLDEEIVNLDHRLRRFQYRLRGPLPVQHHLATLDVLDVGESSVVVYSTEVTPDPLALIIGSAARDALAELKAQMES